MENFPFPISHFPFPISIPKGLCVYSDDFYMALALALAERGRGRTSPNPLVGAVVVDREGVVVGRGAHEIAGGPHAEVYALEDAGARARGATLYCTLEPCSHTGRTGPCAPLVVEAGIVRAVVAIEDPNPRVSGAGFGYLRARGVDVRGGVGSDAAERLNAPFLSVMRRGRPFVTVKVALSRDGCIAAEPGVRTALTGPSANRYIHRERAEVDALAVGSGTLLADDPQLTARGAFRYRPLTRVVFDSRLRTPPTAKLLSTRRAGPVIIMSTPSTAERQPGSGARPDRCRCADRARRRRPAAGRRARTAGRAGYHVAPRGGGRCTASRVLGGGPGRSVRSLPDAAGHRSGRPAVAAGRTTGVEPRSASGRPVRSARTF